MDHFKDSARIMSTHGFADTNKIKGELSYTNASEDWIALLSTFAAAGSSK